jgi:GT2 family glycosyltransferase
MKKRLRHRLPYSLRKLSRRLIVRLVGPVVSIIKDVLNIATTNGFDFHSAWNQGTQVSSANTNEDAPVLLGFHDFLFLMDVITDQRQQRSPISSTECNIRTSIIIPVFNKVSYTFACLRALFFEIDPQSSEIIIIDNASQDETPRLLSYFKSTIRIISNAENMGFVEACNQGASVASGEYLVFLNNDTIVQPGWLANLLYTAENDQAVGAVGSMLIYPDGRLQEAGGIVWKDGDASNYGRGEDQANQKYNFAREVDYCSGASLLVRKKLFDELGGFDKRYAPAYYEDTDLCFGIRSLGFKVVYQPLSRVVHHEGITSGTDVRRGFKRYQQINRAKFVEKWRDVLEREQPDFDQSLVDIVADRRRGPRIIIFDQMIPTPDQDSGSLRMFMILKTLARMGRITFVPIHLPTTRECELILGKEGIKVVHRGEYKDLIKTGHFQTAILSRAAVADEVLPSLKGLDKQLKIIFDTVDVHFLRLEREYKVTGEQKYAEESAFFKKQETHLAAACDQVWCVTPDDKEVLEREVPTANIKVVPNIHALHDRGNSFNSREGLLFVGNFNHRPNVDALRFYFHHILPHIQESLSGLKLYVAGSNMSEEIYDYASADVIVLGYIPDLTPLFSRSRLFIAPLRYGSGMKGKIGQALSYGLPVITTTIGAEGMGLKHGHEAMLVDEPQAFAATVVQAYSSQALWQHLSDKGYEHLKENFSPPVIEEKIIDVIEELNSSRAVRLSSQRVSEENKSERVTYDPGKYDLNNIRR